jgi:hypothetical protein
VDYKVQQGVQEDRGFQDSYEYHRKNREEYGALLKPISIVVTERIVSCVAVWKELVTFIATKEGITEDAAKKKVIWVTSSIPAESSKEGKEVRKLLGQSTAEKLRKENIHPKRIDEKRASNRRGPNGNKWLFPDLAGIEDLSADWVK